jgi:hypothetical protein
MTIAYRLALVRSTCRHEGALHDARDLLAVGGIVVPASHCRNAEGRDREPHQRTTNVEERHVRQASRCLGLPSSRQSASALQARTPSISRPPHRARRLQGQRPDRTRTLNSIAAPARRSPTSLSTATYASSFVSHRPTNERASYRRASGTVVVGLV